MIRLSFDTYLQLFTTSPSLEMTLSGWDYKVGPFWIVYTKKYR